jgi:hypothetical protein
LPVVGFLRSGPHTIPFALEASETFDIGSDTGTGVNDADYQTPFALDGKLNSLTLRLASGRHQVATIEIWDELASGLEKGPDDEGQGHTEEQIISILKEHEARVKTADMSIEIFPAEFGGPPCTLNPDKNASHLSMFSSTRWIYASASIRNLMRSPLAAVPHQKSPVAS